MTEIFILQFCNAALVIALLLMIFKKQDKRMDSQDKQIGDAMKKVDGQPSKEYCLMQHASVKEKFHEGDERFDKLETKIDDVQKCISNVDKNVAVLIERSNQKDG
jgi:hypothetical protein